MVEKISYVESSGTEPYKNIALEECLLNNAEKGECILYLWQNKNTVVIGRNQNCWKECKTAQLNGEGGRLARRLSGGGAVYHDIGNLNFTFIIHEENFNVDRQLKVILLALKKLGIAAEKTGRNDITVEGKKFSGNAFYSSQGRCYHHGTLMVNVDIKSLQKYLNVSAEKLQLKGVDSVRSRVINLSEISEGLTIALLKEKLIEAFGETYGLKPCAFAFDRISEEEQKSSEQKFSSWDWIYGRKIEFQYEIVKRFWWGDISIQMNVKGGKIAEAAAYSDAMHQKLISDIPSLLENCRFNKIDICTALSSADISSEEEKEIMGDILGLLEEQDF